MPDNVTTKDSFDHWLAKQPGVMAHENEEGQVYFNKGMGMAPGFSYQAVKDYIGTDPAKILDDPKNADMKQAVMNYVRDETSGSPWDLKDKIAQMAADRGLPKQPVISAEPAAEPSAPVAPAAPAAPDPQKNAFDHWLAKQPGVMAHENEEGKVYFNKGMGMAPGFSYQAVKDYIGNDPAKFMQDHPDVQKAVMNYVHDENTVSPWDLKDKVKQMMEAQPAPQAEISTPAPPKPPASAQAASATAAPAAAAAQPAAAVPPIAAKQAFTAAAAPVAQAAALQANAALSNSKPAEVKMAPASIPPPLKQAFETAAEPAIRHAAPAVTLPAGTRTAAQPAAATPIVPPSSQPDHAKSTIAAANPAARAAQAGRSELSAQPPGKAVYDEKVKLAQEDMSKFAKLAGVKIDLATSKNPQGNDGFFEGKTKTAVIEVQKALGMEATGKITPDFTARMDAKIAEMNAAAKTVELAGRQPLVVQGAGALTASVLPSQSQMSLCNPANGAVTPVMSVADFNQRLTSPPPQLGTTRPAVKTEMSMA